MIGKGLLVGCRALSAGSLYRMKGLRGGGSSSPGGLAALMMRADAVHGRGPSCCCWRVRETLWCRVLLACRLSSGGIDGIPSMPAK